MIDTVYALLQKGIFLFISALYTTVSCWQRLRHTRMFIYQHAAMRGCCPTIEKNNRKAHDHDTPA